jgi:hypothetical protein
VRVNGNEQTDYHSEPAKANCIFTHGAENGDLANGEKSGGVRECCQYAAM